MQLSKNRDSAVGSALAEHLEVM